MQGSLNSSWSWSMAAQADFKNSGVGCRGMKIWNFFLRHMICLEASDWNPTTLKVPPSFKNAAWWLSKWCATIQPYHDPMVEWHAVIVQECHAYNDQYCSCQICRGTYAKAEARNYNLARWLCSYQAVSKPSSVNVKNEIKRPDNSRIIQN